MIKKLFELEENSSELTIQELKEIINNLPDDMVIKMDIDSGDTSFCDKVRYIQVAPGEKTDVLKIQNW